MPGLAVTLSCEECRRRKTKCDKKAPCSACELAGISCTTIQRPRRPRGRHARNHNRDLTLQARVAQLEDLVKTFGSRVEESRTTTQTEQLSSLPPVPLKANTLFARDLIAQLSEQVSGIRDALEEPDSDASGNDQLDREPTLPTPSASSQTLSQSLAGDFLFDSHTAVPHQEVLRSPSQHVRTTLLEVFRQRIDFVFKTVFLPGATAAFHCASSATGCLDAAREVDTFIALERAIYFISICVLSEQECKIMLHEDKSDLLSLHKKATETAMLQVGLLRNPDKLVIMAFVLYLMSMRILKQYTYCWTLLPVAVRIARLIGLPLSNTVPRPSSTLVQLRDEIHLRIWESIAVLDTQASLDRATQFLMPMNSFLRRPTLLNDADCETDTLDLTPKQNLSDMSFVYVTGESNLCWRRISEVPADDLGTWTAWERRVQIVSNFERRMREYCAGFEASLDPRARLTASHAEDLVLELKLALRRPLHRSMSPKTIAPPWDDFDVLQCTTSLMESYLRKVTDSSISQYAWYFNTWSKWHILAALLAELSTPRDGRLAERAYIVARQEFDHCATLMAGTDLDLIWRLIEKLMRRVDQVRAAMRNGTASRSKSYGPEDGVSPTVRVFHDDAYAVDIDSMGGQAEFLPHLEQDTVPDPSLLEMLDSLPNDENGSGQNMPWEPWGAFVQDLGMSWDTLMTPSWSHEP